MSGPMRILNKVDLSDLASIVGKNGESTQELISVLLKLVNALGEIKQKEANVNFDVEALASALNKNRPVMPEMKAPEIKMEAPVIDMKAIVNEMEARRESISYEFNIKRGSDGKIVSVIANPI